METDFPVERSFWAKLWGLFFAFGDGVSWIMGAKPPGRGLASMVGIVSLNLS